MTLRRRLALAGALLSAAGIILARRYEGLSLISVILGGALLGVAASFTALRAKRDIFGAWLVAFLLWLTCLLGVTLVWLLRVFEPPVD
jgi:hypothetical protein